MTTDITRSNLLRRLLAISYDCLLLTGLLFLATAALLPFTGGKAIHSGNFLFMLYLLFCNYLYFGWQWTHGGQTLGMRAWKIRLMGLQQQPVNWTMASKRFGLALLSWMFLGAGFFWSLIDAQGLTFHDRYSETGLFRV